MTNRDGPVGRAIRVAVDDERRVLAEISLAQRMAGLSDSDVGGACRMSRWMVARILAGKRRASVVELAAIGATVGLDIRTHAYPSGDPIRDAGQQRLLERLRSVLHPSLGWHTEVPLPGDRDLRAWDAVIRGDRWWLAIEAETVITDVQALERRLARKMRDGGSACVILLVADTRRNRRAMNAAPAAFAGFSRQPRPVLAAIRDGRDPGTSAIVFL